MPLDYSIVIPAFNEETLLPSTLSALTAAMRAVSDRRGECILVDNDSTDRTAQIAADAGLRVVHEPHRQISKARNTGAAASTGECLIFIDADTWLTPEHLRGALDALQAGYCGGGARLKLDASGVDMYLAQALWGAISRTRHWAAGSFIYCQRQTFQDIGGFDESRYVAEDVVFSIDLNRWARKNRSSVRILPTPIISSARKFSWYGKRRVLGQLLRFAIRPSNMKRRDDCNLWYERPPQD